MFTFPSIYTTLFWVAFSYAVVSAEGDVFLSTVFESVDAPSHEEDHVFHMAL